MNTDRRGQSQESKLVGSFICEVSQTPLCFSNETDNLNTYLLGFYPIITFDPHMSLCVT